MSPSPKKGSGEKRVLNEVEAKILNEESSDTVIELRKDTKVSDHANMLFACECDVKNCPKTISISTQEYAQVHRKSMHFIVIPSHVRPDIEEVITSFTSYCVVKKLFPQPRTV